MELHVTKRKGREIVVLLDNDMRIVKPVSYQITVMLMMK